MAAVQTQIDKSQDPIVILGTGLAGYNLAKALRKLNPTQPISMYTADDGSYYSKPSLSTGFANNKSAQALALKSAEEMAESLEIDIHIHSPIKRIDADNRSIELVSGGRRSYHKLVIAVGANCINAPLQGDGLAQVYQVNTLQDYARFRLVAKHAKRIAIIGGGLIGCEYANDLIQSGYSVDVIDPLAAPIATLLPQAASARVQQALEAAGVNFHFGTVAESVDQVEGGLEVSLANGETLSCDLVLSAIGVRPNLQLAQEAGLKTERGICVDTQLQTSKEHIYAIGDCAQVSGLVLCYIAPLTDQVKALSQILTGQPSQVSYGAMPVQIKTTLHPILVNPPANNAQGEWKVIEDQASGVNLQYLDAQGQLLGFALTGDQVKHGGELRKRSPNLL
nr:FAD-dependent oxidoreductase [Paraferrimonas sedimenticola]